jgi:hypothetical protein
LPLYGRSFTGKKISDIIISFATQYKAEVSYISTHFFTYELCPTNAFIPVSVTNFFKNIIQTWAYIIWNFDTNFLKFSRARSEQSVAYFRVLL